MTVTPGSPGIPGSVASPATEKLDADLFVIGPEAPLVDGLADRLRAQGKLVYGPGADGARLEGSKAYMKEVVAAAGVPTARYGAFDELGPALDFLRGLPGPYVVKTDGLAAGKGVLVTSELTVAEDDVGPSSPATPSGTPATRWSSRSTWPAPSCRSSRSATASGPSRSPPPRTSSGSATVTPAPTPAAWARIRRCPAWARTGRRRRARRLRRPHPGRTAQPGHRLPGHPLCRADAHRRRPQAHRVQRPLRRSRVPGRPAPHHQRPGGAAGRGRRGTHHSEPTVSDDACVAVALAAEHYPAPPRTGDLIAGLADAGSLEGVEIFYAGVGESDGGRLLTSGGRVLYVVGRAPTIEAARLRAYDGVSRISWSGMHHRGDIAADPT